METLTKGFTASHPSLPEFRLSTEVFELGIYIFTFEKGILLDQTARKNPERAKILINTIRKELEAKGYTILDSPKYHKIKINPKTLKYKLSL